MSVTAYEKLQGELRGHSHRWLITGAAGFIGSNLLESLLKLDQQVVGLDNYATGYQRNLEHVRSRVTAEQWSRCKLMEGDIRDGETCQRACTGAEFVLHQAALGSVPRSIAEPLNSHESNVTGFINLLIAARDQKVRRLVYASSSSVYGDDPELPKVEDKTGKPLSPYAATKLMNEIYAGVFAQTYDFRAVGLRYFNVFGPRQDPNGAYAAVIPKWIAAMLQNEAVIINGDGETSRDFCYISNVVQANLLAATTNDPQASNQAYNVAVGERTTLNELYRLLQQRLVPLNPTLAGRKPVYHEFRAGDVRHSLADITKAQTLLGYAPTHSLPEGLDLALPWYLNEAGQG
jgi:UDP-N-acetylglucosamine 4-epimerase